MKLQHLARQDGRFVRRYEYDDGSVVVGVDLGDPGAAVDVVDGTAIVVPTGGDQFELDLPARDSEVFMNNGVLTIEVKG